MTMLPRILKNNRAIAVIGLVFLVGLIFYMRRGEKMTLDEIIEKIKKAKPRARRNAKPRARMVSADSDTEGHMEYNKCKVKVKKVGKQGELYDIYCRGPSLLKKGLLVDQKLPSGGETAPQPCKLSDFPDAASVSGNKSDGCVIEACNKINKLANGKCVSRYTAYPNKTFVIENNELSGRFVKRDDEQSDIYKLFTLQECHYECITNPDCIGNMHTKFTNDADIKIPGISDITQKKYSDGDYGMCAVFSENASFNPENPEITLLETNTTGLNDTLYLRNDKGYEYTINRVSQ